MHGNRSRDRPSLKTRNPPLAAAGWCHPEGAGHGNLDKPTLPTIEADRNPDFSGALLACVEIHDGASARSMNGEALCRARPEEGRCNRDPSPPVIEVPDSLPPARRRSRRPFHPSRHVDPVYRLPPAVADRLAAALQGRRTAERAYRLAIYLARHWSAPAALLEAFTVAARRFDGTGGLVEVLDMTAAEIRGALKALEEVGFVVREIGKGNGFQPTAAGLRKAPIRFRFGPDYWPLFKAANARSTNSHRGRGFAPKIASRRD